MKRKTLIVVFLCFSFLKVIYAFDGEKLHRIIEAFKDNDRNEISNMFVFPISRRYPIKKIESREEFLERYDEILDSELINLIMDSKIENDWSEVGWRGYTLKAGVLWVNNNYKIYAVNYETNAEKLKWNKLVDNDKKGLPRELQDYDAPILKWKMEKNIIRVDKTGDKYRIILANVISKKIELVLDNGNSRSEGSIGNYSIDWIRNKRIYSVYVDVYDFKNDCYLVFPGDCKDLYDYNNAITREVPIIEE